MSLFDSNVILRIGQEVTFNEKVFNYPYAPYYNAYKDHTFEVVAFHYEDTHVELICVTDRSLIVDGYVHPDELVPV